MFSGVGLFCIDSKDLTRSLLCQVLSLRCQGMLCHGTVWHLSSVMLGTGRASPESLPQICSLVPWFVGSQFYQLSLWKLLTNSGLGCCQRFCKSGVPPSPCRKTCLRESSDKEKAKVSSKLGSLKEETRGHLPISKRI